MEDIYKRLKELEIELPEPSVPIGLFRPVNQVGNTLYVSGQGSYYRDEIIKGKLGKDVTVEKGRLGAKYCMMNALAALDQYLGDLNRIKKVVKLLGFVNGADDFGRQPEVVNGASQLLIDLFGENGKHARSAIGTNSLPNNISVEIEAIFEIE